MNMNLSYHQQHQHHKPYHLRNQLQRKEEDHYYVIIRTPTSHIIESESRHHRHYQRQRHTRLISLSNDFYLFLFLLLIYLNILSHITSCLVLAIVVIRFLLNQIKFIKRFCFFVLNKKTSKRLSSVLLLIVKESTSKFSTKNTILFYFLIVAFLCGFSNANLSDYSSANLKRSMSSSLQVDENSNSQYSNAVDYDIHLFNELNMIDTIQSLFRSCFKEDFMESKEQLNYYLNTGDRNSTKNSDLKYKLVNELLHKFLNRDITKLSINVLDIIDSICLADKSVKSKQSINENLNKKNLHLINKLFTLSDYEHPSCGNIFRNSISRSHLINDILKLNTDRPEVKLLKKNKPILKMKSQMQQNNTSNIVDYALTTTIRVRTESAKNSILTNDKNDNSKYSIRDESDSTSNTKKRISNCTLILLNVYLLAFKSNCDFDSFIESLNHYDCQSNNFSVNSDCNKCQNAYKKWSCSINVPYYINEKPAKPCQRYCYDVQNLCPFFRPVDTYGGQPVFHCRNVVQVVESKRLDGYEDDDEHYEDHDLNDEDTCYSTCVNNIETIESESNLTIIPVDLTEIYKENANLNQSSPFSLYELWQSLNLNFYDDDFSVYQLDAALTKNRNKFIVNSRVSLNKTFNLKGRFHEAYECLYNIAKSSASSSLSSFSSNHVHYSILNKLANKVIFIFILIFQHVIWSRLLFSIFFI